MAIIIGTAKPGDLVGGKYAVERIIGQGGAAYVVAAQHVLMQRRVALKFLRPELAVHTDVCRRFIREARNAGRMKGDHAARILDVDALPTGLPYLVMEYLDGEDLAAVLGRRGRLPAPEVVEYALQACEAVSEAHALRIIHRDIKPSNLFLTEGPGGLPFIKVLDFGLSKVLDGEDWTDNVTDSNRVMGSPHFMSPEQIRTPHEVDERTDVWSLGATLFTLLTDRVPFDGRSLMEVCAALLCGPQPRVARFCSDVPPALENVVLRCLRLDPKDRYPSTAELVRDLTTLAAPPTIASVGRPDSAAILTRQLPPAIARAAARPIRLALGVGAIAFLVVSIAGRWTPRVPAIAIATDTASASAPEEVPPPLWVDETRPRAVDGGGVVAAQGRPDVRSRAVSDDHPRAPGVPRLFASTAARGSPMPSETPSETASGDASCGHPFYIDSRGIKTIRRECM
ncbi:MAG: serine/threonine-protein kinase [Polyangiaceae bacterium]|jgi:serine/threonine-protein kinase